MENQSQPATTRHGNVTARSRRPNLSHLDPAFVRSLSVLLPAQTAECIQDTFGISANTWLKLRKGMPIRRSVALRLLKRFGEERRHG